LQFWVLVVGLLAFPALGQMPQRLLGRDVARYLDLTVEQVTRLVRIDTGWSSYRAERSLRARQLQDEIDAEARKSNADRAGLKQRNLELETICRHARERRAQVLHEARAVLNPGQVAKLAQLEQAFALMPIIESAQALNLMPNSLSGPPPGMPEGTVETQFTFTRGKPDALPGCPAMAQRIYPGVELNDSVKGAGTMKR